MLSINQTNATAISVRLNELMSTNRGLSRGIKRLFSDLGWTGSPLDEQMTSRVHVGFVFDYEKTWCLDFHSYSESASEVTKREIGRDPLQIQRQLFAQFIKFDEVHCNPKWAGSECGTLKPKMILVPEACEGTPFGFLLVPKIEFILPTEEKLDQMTNKQKGDMLNWIYNVIFTMRGGILKPLAHLFEEGDIYGSDKYLEMLGIKLSTEERMTFDVGTLETTKFENVEDEYLFMSLGTRLLGVMKSHHHLFGKLEHEHDAVLKAALRLKNVAEEIEQTYLSTLCE
jgi:hypothetical protein